MSNSRITPKQASLFSILLPVSSILIQILFSPTTSEGELPSIVQFIVPGLLSFILFVIGGVLGYSAIQLGKRDNSMGIVIGGGVGIAISISPLLYSIITAFLNS